MAESIVNIFVQVFLRKLKRAEAKGNLALLAVVVEDLLCQAAEWSSSWIDIVGQVQNPGGLAASLDLCADGTPALGGGDQGGPCRVPFNPAVGLLQHGGEAAMPRRAAAVGGSWHLVDER